MVNTRVGVCPVTRMLWGHSALSSRMSPPLSTAVSAPMRMCSSPCITSYKVQQLVVLSSSTKGESY